MLIRKCDNCKKKIKKGDDEMIASLITHFAGDVESRF